MEGVSVSRNFDLTLMPPIYFALPGIHDLPTGGNKYNSKLLHVLEGKLEVIPFFPERGDHLPAYLPRGSIILVDSLLVENAAGMREHYAHAKFLLLLHYLETFDSSKEGSPNSSVLTIFDGIITTSEYSRQTAISYGYPPSKVVVVYPGIEKEFRPAPESSTSSTVRLLTVANHLPGKGLVEFVELLEGLETTRWTWTLVGDQSLDPTYSQKLYARIADSMYFEKMKLVPACSGKELIQHYQQADVFVLPSFFETLSMASREALRCGLPVVAYDVGGLNESVKDGVNGKLITPYHHATFQSVLDVLITNRLQREQLGHQARHLAREFPDWRSMGFYFTDAIDTLAGLTGSR